MSPVVAAAGLSVALGILLVVVNQIQARVALVELALNEGLPPGHARNDTAAASPRIDPRAALGAGVHVFLSRTCHACQRLVDELGRRPIGHDGLHLHFVDRPRPLARDAARLQQAPLHEHQQELAAAIGADPLPYTIAIGPHDLLARSVTPTASSIGDVAREAGLEGVKR